ncbi:MAG: M48 family metalloprotease, partial [Actinobacteria bacterium]|nr:M48 family metalloprotease [Actinomycetota bacterium]
VAVPALVAWTPAGRRWVARVVGRVGERRPARAAAVVGVLVAVITDVVLLPLAFWAGYVHEGRFGFRTQSLAAWGYDWLVSQLPGWLGLVAVLVAGTVIVRRLPRAWPPVAGLGGAALGSVGELLSPLVLEPLWFDLRPLPPGATRTAVERVIDRSGERVGRLLVADASRRTTKENAYVSGVGTTRRVVLYDTLVRQGPPRRVGMVLAHELGHERHADVLRFTLLSGGGAVVGAYAVALGLRRRVRIGRQATQADPRAVPVVLAMLALLTVAGLPGRALVSRRAEAAADLTALRITDDPATFIRMSAGFTRTNLSDPAPPTWAYLLWSTHPSSSARLAMGHWWRAAHGPGAGG